ncbi:MAG: hypothetical protein U9O41_03205 [Candidatus Aerophobetes bacterium]|nr:hypothetical protein [Candidatus Aerophobetes bacterium]
MKEIEINLTLRFRMPENGLNVNGILMGLRNASSKVSFALLKALFSAIEEQTIEQMQKKFPGRYIHNGHQRKARELRTSFGPFHYYSAQLYDKLSKKTVVPLRKNGFLPKYRRYTKEAMEAGIGSAVHLSYRWSSKEIARIREQAPSVSASTLHRHLQEFAEQKCSWPNLKKVPYRFLMVDGTGVRLQGYKGTKMGKSEMRWALASLGENEPFEPVGFWINKSWNKIKKDLEARLNYDHLEVLFSDGGPGIEEALLEKGMRHQRCVLHGKRDFSYILYIDGLKKAEQLPLREKLAAIPVFQFNKEKIEELSPEDLPKVKDLAERTKQGFKEMIDLLDPQRYPRARSYIENLSKDIATFFSWWLENKTWIPINTNAIESGFSQVKNRIWSVGKRWSEKGLLNWLHVTMNKIFFPEMWKELWAQYMSLNPQFQLTHLRVSWKWC